MGYTTDFDGTVTIVPPLNDKEIKYLNAFSDTRRMDRTKGPYYVGDTTNGIDVENDVINSNQPPMGQPGVWCQWIPTEDGTAIEWDGNEKFYNALEWMEYIIEHFFGDRPLARIGNIEFDFLQCHTINGFIEAHGEEVDDIWAIKVTNNKVKLLEGKIVFEDKDDNAIEGEIVPELKALSLDN